MAAGNDPGMDLAARKRWSLILLVLWLPLYVVLVWVALNLGYDHWGRPPIWVEAPIYLILAFVWALPFKRVFLGAGRGATPEEEAEARHRARGLSMGDGPIGPKAPR